MHQVRISFSICKMLIDCIFIYIFIYIYSAFPLLSASQSVLHSCSAAFCRYFYHTPYIHCLHGRKGQFGIQHLAQGHFGMHTCGAGDQTPDLLAIRQSALPPPEPREVKEVFHEIIMCLEAACRMGLLKVLSEKVFNWSRKKQSHDVL